MMQKLILGVLFWTAIFPLCNAQLTGRAYAETHQLVELKTWDEHGHETFKKWCLSDTDFEMEASLRDADGQLERKWEVLWRGDFLIVREWRYFPDRVETWTPLQSMRLSADPELAQAISTWKRDGLPRSQSELTQMPVIVKILKSPLYCAELSTLNPAGLPLKTTYFDETGEMTGEEKSTYNLQGQCIRFTEQEFGDEETFLESQLTYDAGARLTKVVQMQSSQGAQDTVMVSQSTYQDSLLLTRLDLIGGMHARHWTKTTRTYNAQNRLIRDEITDSEGRIPASSKTFTYDTHGRLATEEWFRRENKALQKIRSVTWVYE